MEWPRISIVTPSFNQGAYLESCLRSVLDQEYPNLDYIVIDGASRDSSVEIIRRHEGRLSFWLSEPDEGHFPALEKGFARASGEILGWLNSDDLYLPWTLHAVGEIFAALPEVNWITSQYPILLDENGLAVQTRRLDGFSRKAFYRGRNVPLTPFFYTGFIQQESTFWRRSLWEKAGSRLDVSLPLACEFELWARFWEQADLYAVGVPLAGFRVQPNQKTGRGYARYLQEAEQVLGRYGQGRPGPLETAARRLLRLLPRRCWRALPEGWAFTSRLIVASEVEQRSFAWRIVEEKFI
jgi:hypothetical protein